MAWQAQSALLLQPLPARAQLQVSWTFLPTYAGRKPAQQTLPYCLCLISAAAATAVSHFLLNRLPETGEERQLYSSRLSIKMAAGDKAKIHCSLLQAQANGPPQHVAGAFVQSLWCYMSYDIVTLAINMSLVKVCLYGSMHLQTACAAWKVWMLTFAANSTSFMCLKLTSCRGAMLSGASSDCRNASPEQRLQPSGHLCTAHR